MKRNWADLMGRALAYVVLRKRNRLQVVVAPTERQLRRRGKRGWQLVAYGEDSGPTDVTDDLREAVLAGIEELHTGARLRQAGETVTVTFGS